MIKVVIVDDHPVVRHGLSELLRDLDDITVVATADDGSAAAEVVRQSGPDVVLMDLSMPGLDGVSATRQVLAASPVVRVVVLTSFGDAEQVRAALDAGAVGFLLKDTEPRDLVRAVRDAAAGGAPLSARAATALLPSASPAPAAESAAAALSPREREVLALVATGLPNKTVARRLGISEKTVKAHLGRVFAVLGVSDRTSAALWAQRHGLTA